MLRSLKDLEGYTIAAMDGDIGSVTNFLVDHARWTIRYLVATTGDFFGSHRVLIAPISFRHSDWSTKSFHVQVTMEKAKHAPSIDCDQSISRQDEMDRAVYHAHPSCWGLAGVPHGGSHLRGVNELRGYHVHGSDEEVGRVEDFIVDDKSWEVRYLIIETSNAWVGTHVLVAPQWAHPLRSDERKIQLNLSRVAVRNSPAWDADAAVNREYETRLYGHYGRPVYWDMPGLPD